MLLRPLLGLAFGCIYLVATYALAIQQADHAPAFDSILMGIICPSRSRLYVGEPINFEDSGKKPSREKIQAAAEKILDGIRLLKEKAETS